MGMSARGIFGARGPYRDTTLDSLHLLGHAEEISMAKIIFLATAALALSLSAAFGGPLPLLSGEYVVNYNEVCQANSNNSDPGKISAQTLGGNFDSKSHTVSFVGNSVDGALVVWNNGTSGLSQSAVSVTWPYSNDGNTIKINGVVYNAFYGPTKSRNGLVYSAVFSGISSPGCAASATMIRR